MKTRRWVVAGTGTDVGKTALAARCARALSVAGHRVLAVKPLETGFHRLEGSDAARLARAARHLPIAPAFHAEEPVAPWRAASNLDQVIDLARFAPWLTALETAHAPELTLVETAGGLFTPLTASETNLDLTLALEPTGWLLVARDRLGALHDAIATVSASRARGCSPAAVIFGTRDGEAPRGNAGDLEGFLGLRVLSNPDDQALTALLLAP